MGFAVLPVALSNRQFASLADPATNSLPSYNLFLGPAGNLAPGTIRGALVNLTPSNSTLTYYNQASSNLNVSQLLANLAYFSPTVTNAEIPSATVERGSLIADFNLNSSIFTSATVQQQLVDRLKQLQVGRSYIFPVISEDPNFLSGETCRVVGFARLRLLAVPAAFTGANFSLTVALEPESVAVRNASFVNGRSSVPLASVNMLPEPIAPFTDRFQVGDGISTRPRSTVMAASLSPRILVD